MVEAGELPGDLVGLIERGVDRAGEPEPVGDGGQRGEHRERVRAADHVQVVEAASLLTQAQSFGQKEEVELRPFRGPCEMHE